MTVPVPLETRLFSLETAVVFLLVGWTWIKGAPRYGSAFGMRFAVAMKSEQNWRTVHRRLGWLALAVGILLALPLPSLIVTVMIQIPLALFMTVFGTLAVKYSVK